MDSTDGALVASNGESSDGITAHGCGAASGAGGIAIDGVDSLCMINPDVELPIEQCV